MKKKGVVIFVLLLIVTAIATVIIVSCNNNKTGKLQVYNFLTTKLKETDKDGNVTILAEKEQKTYQDEIIKKHNTANIDDLEKLNNIANRTTFVIEELILHVRFVKDTSVGCEGIEKAFEEYESAQKYANQKLEEAVQTTNSADWGLLVDVLIERYSVQVQKYNKLAQEILNYTNKACFASNPKTVTFTTLSFIQNYNSYIVKEYVKGKKLSTSSLTITQESETLKNKYISLKNSSRELIYGETVKVNINGTQVDRSKAEVAIRFVDAFYTFKDMGVLYDALSKGMSNLKLFAENKAGYSGDDILIQVQAKMDIYNFISMSDFV